MRKLDPGVELAHKALGQRVRRLRQKKGMSQEAFAAKCGIGTRYVARIEMGETTLPFSVLTQLAEGLDTTLFALLKGIA